MSSDTLQTGQQSLLDFNHLFDNPVFAGGFGLASLGAVLAFARRGAISAAVLVRRRLLVHVEISRQDPAYPWILAWLSEPRLHTSFLAKRLTRINTLSVTTINHHTSPNGPSNASFFLQPGYGHHIVKYKYAYIAVERMKQSTANMNTGEPHETMALTTLYAYRHIFEDIFTEAHAKARQAIAGKTVVYMGRKRFLARLHELGLFAEPKDGEMAPPIRTSTAAIQGLFLFHKDDMEGAIAMADALVMPPPKGESQ
ncbi:BCS1 protein precursor [Apiospora phragmitis]|uniref:BCS1 protein n=1 Tax=Apiospora phragmitis TaxID=2905665 RepID=A0ABR1VF03_9PEZI